MLKQREKKSPDKIDFRQSLKALGSDAVIINQNLATERARPSTFRAKYHFFWEREYYWVVIAIHNDGEVTASDHQGSFWPGISGADPSVLTCHIFKNNGMYHRSYERVYNYFKKLEDFSIIEFSLKERQTIWKLLGRGISQWDKAA